MTDLTKITTPYGLLDEATQKALRECGGPWEVVDNDGWEDIADPGWHFGSTYRQKPQPPKPREWWLVRHDEEHAWQVMHSMPQSPIWVETIHVREVIEP